MTEGPYSHLTNPAEREWLTSVAPIDVVKNAHRIYAFMNEAGLGADSYTRELAFDKASAALGVPYDVLDDAWLTEKPIDPSAISTIETEMQP